MTAAPELLRGAELRSINPATLELVGAVTATDPEAVPEVVAESRLAHERWARTNHAERRRLFGAIARVLIEKMDQLAAVVTAENGKPLAEAYTAEVLVAVDNVRWIEANAERVLRPEPVRFTEPYLKHKRGRLLHEPLGVVAVISPWNFPFSIPFVQVATAVAAGNAVVVKPSELTPLTGDWISRVFDEAGVPAGLVRVVQGDGAVGEALVRARGVSRVVFTGSTEVGRRVAAIAGERLCPVTLELGGKDPMLVFADADLERAAAGAAFGAFANCGQVCTSVERIYVARERHDEFVQALARRAGELRLGRGDDPGVELGPMISEEQRARAEALVDDALARGAQAVVGGRRPAIGLPGWFYEPSVLTGVDDEAGMQRDEVFGPVVSVQAFGSEEEAIRLANGTRYGLGASVWTADAARARRVAGRLETGMVWANDVSYSFGVGAATWGGRKDSGFGRTRSRYGLLECSQVKFADADSGRVPVPWWYPYGPAAVDGFRGLIRTVYGRGLVPRAAAAWTHKRGLAALGRRYVSRG